tara:strand:- start:2261 stop:2746 length:486 start_codon:yes stop_codon:yes gene_type:complete
MMGMNVNAYFRPSVEWDISFLAPWLRREDKDTIQWMTDMTPYDGLHYSWLNSNESNTIVVNDTVVGMFGVAGQLYNEGCPWLLMSDFLERDIKLHRIFLVESRKWIQQQQQLYTKMFNFVSQTHTQHIKWLEWLGFKVLDLYPEFGPYKKPFLYFEMEGKR